MANFGSISSETIIPAGQTIARNSDDTGFEAVTPVKASGVGKITVGTVAPGAPSVGDLWVDTN